MEYRQLGYSGLRVPCFSLGTATFGGSTAFFKTWGETDQKQANRLIDICLEAGVNFFDTADIYSMGMAEEILGKALQGKREKALISTKATFPMGEGANHLGSSRHHLMEACHASLKRLGTDHIDVYFMHGFDALTPVEETLATLDHLIQSGKVRYIGCSNYSGWQVMKSLAISEKHQLARYAVYQGYYSLVGREYEWELMPLGRDQNLGLMVWSPLGWGRLTGKIRRNQPIVKGRIQAGGGAGGPEVPTEYLYQVVDVLDVIAQETGKTLPQIALNWLLQRPTVCNIVMGARDETQLRQNLGALDWKLSQEHIAMLDAASKCKPIYPYWHQSGFPNLNPFVSQW
jgi:aryl-alcohol dehydrogenase-like predicted oxidoreductase